MASIARPSASIFFCAALSLSVGDAGDQQVLPDRQPDIAVAQVARDLGKAVHLRDRHAADRHRDADPIAGHPASARWMPIWAVRSNGGRGSKRARHGTVELAAELLLHQRRGISRRPCLSSTYFSRALVRSVRSPVSMNTRTTASATLRGVGGLHQHAGVAGETVMAGQAAEAEPEPDAGRKAEAVFHLDRLEADVVGVFQHRHDAGAVEARR